VDQALSDNQQSTEVSTKRGASSDSSLDKTIVLVIVGIVGAIGVIALVVSQQIIKSGDYSDDEL
jgi:hypothetical protein